MARPANPSCTHQSQGPRQTHDRPLQDRPTAEKLVVSKEQHVHIEVEQVRDGEEHRLQHLGLGAYPNEQVHRPIRLVLIHCGQPGDHGDARSSPGRGEFEARFDRPVCDQRQQQPLPSVVDLPGAVLGLPESGHSIGERSQLRHQRKQLLDLTGLRDLRRQQQPAGGAQTSSGGVSAGTLPCSSRAAWS